MCFHYHGSMEYNEICALTPPYGLTKSGLIWQVVFYQSYKYIHIWVHVPAKVVLYDSWSLNAVVLKQVSLYPQNPMPKQGQYKHNTMTIPSKCTYWF